MWKTAWNGGKIVMNTMRITSKTMPTLIWRFERSPREKTEAVSVRQLSTCPIWAKTMAARHIVVART